MPALVAVRFPNIGVGFRVVGMGDLTNATIARWLELRPSNPALDSPYFHPGFTAAVAAICPNVRVIVGQDTAGTSTSFLRVQFDSRTCRPAGFPLISRDPFVGPAMSST